MDFNKVSPSDREESKNVLFGQTLRIPNVDETESAEEDYVHIDASVSSPPMEDLVFAQLFSKSSSYMFRGTRIFSLLLEEGAMWISGCDGMSKQVLWKVNVPNFKVLLKKTIENSKASWQIIMVSFGKQILFSVKGGSEIHGINTETQLFETVFKDVRFQIDAMCCNDDHLYIFQKKSPDIIQILDSKFQSVGNIPTGFRENWTYYSEYEVDFCTSTTPMNTSTEGHSSSEFKTKHQHMCIISMSNPTPRHSVLWGAQYSADIKAIQHPSVRAVNETGVMWALDSRSFRELDNRFNPCSVSTSATGDVFIADNGADRVSRFVDIVTVISDALEIDWTRRIITASHGMSL